MSSVPASGQHRLSADFAKLFSGADTNGDGFVAKLEAQTARKNLLRGEKSAGDLSGSQLSQTFRSLDANRDKQVSVAELAALHSRTSSPEIPPKVAIPAERIAPGSRDADRSQATAGLPALSGSSTALEALIAASIDRNCDDCLSKDEVERGRKALRQGGGEFASISGSAAASGFRLADTDNNRRLSLSEITVLLASRPEPPIDKPTPQPQVDGPGGPVRPGEPGGPTPPLAPFPITGAYATDKLGAINVWGMAGEPQSAERPYSIAYSDDVLRVEVREGDRRQKPSEASRSIERSEISLPANPFVFEQTYKMHFDVLFEGQEASTARNDKFFQIHNVNDPGDASLGPVFAMQLEGERMRMVVRSDDRATTTIRPDDIWVFEDTANIERDHWYRFDVILRVDPFGDGLLSVRRDGEEVASYRGPLGYNDVRPPYPKVGIYRDTQGETQARRYRDLSIQEV